MGGHVIIAISAGARKIRTLNEATVKALPKPASGNKVYWFAGDRLQGKVAPAGFGVRVTAGSSRAFVLDYRVNGQKRRYTIGEHGTWSVVAAVVEAHKLRKKIDKGDDPQAEKERARSPEPGGKTVSGVLDEFIIRYAKPKLRGAGAIGSAFERHVKPHLGNVVIYDLTRKAVAEMLDKIEDRAGPVMADRTRAYFRKALAWYTERDDDFNLDRAIVRVEPRSTSDGRNRVLSDNEIRTLWPALTGTFGALVKTLLLTGQRRGEVAGMRRSEIGADEIWEIPAERMKGKVPHAVPLAPAVAAIIEAQPAGDLVFPSSADTPFTAFGDAKADLDRRAPIEPWRLHDLRRTARSLMSRAGVDSDVAERTIGHALVGVRKVYDRHDYVVQKRAALEKHAALVEHIVNPPADNVETLDAKRAHVAGVTT
jgi:integrase